MTRTIPIRFDEDVVKRLDAQQARMKKEATPGMRVTRTDVIRTLVLQALEWQEKKKR